MPGDERRISPVACVLLVTLRLFIGWHLLYEGLWKYHTQSTSQPWTSEGYLRNATGPFRSYFRSLTGDPKDQNWLDYDTVAARWDGWANRYASHYPGAAEAPAKGRSQSDQIQLMLNGPKEFAVELAALPDGADLSRWQKSIRFDAAKQRLIVDGTQHLLPSERDAILAQTPLIETPTAEQAAQAELVRKYHDAVNRLFTLQSRLSYKERLAVLLKGDPDRVGTLQTEKGGAVIEKRMGDIERYQKLLDKYEQDFALARTGYQWDHLSRGWSELQQLRRQLIGPVQALESELKTKATEMLGESQLLAGPVPEPLTPIRSIDLQTMWGLMICGGLLITGLFTRLGALGAAGLLTMFYLAMPPWPGSPPEVGIEHNFIVNKVLIEATACLAFAALPTGRWFGVDALLALLFYRRRRD